jgi:transcriptional regulator with XRE-family HTH domain
MTVQNSLSHDVAAGHFSSLLKHWRNVRRLTQIELAGDANVSARHLCFLETGRAQPSREMVQLLGSALDLPLEERNALHVAAGFVPPYGDRGLAADNLQHVRQAFDFILRQQEPLVRATNRHTRRRDGKEVTGMTTYTDTYLFENGAWKCIQAQLTTVAPEHQPADDTIVSVYIEGQRQERLS